jgi:hypothetical protein
MRPGPSDGLDHRNSLVGVTADDLAGAIGRPEVNVTDVASSLRRPNDLSS